MSARMQGTDQPILETRALGKRFSIGTRFSSEGRRVVHAVDKKRARLNMIDHLLSLIPYGDVPKPDIELPERIHSPDYVRHPVPDELHIPEKY